MPNSWLSISDSNSSLSPAVTQASPVLTAAKQLLQHCLFASEEQAQAALDAVGGDQDLAIEVLISRAPSIKDSPREWFHFFDTDNSGTMDESELSRAIVATLKVDQSAEYVDNLVREWFREFDLDGNHHWDIDEFLSALPVILAALGVENENENDPEAMKKHMEEATLESQANAAIRQLRDGLAMCEGCAMAVYFCARCMDLPGRNFTEILIERYERYQKNNVPMELMIVPMDDTEANFIANERTWIGSDGFEMAWLGETEWSKRGMWKQLAAILDVRSLPSLVVLDNQANVLTRNGVSCCAADEEGEHFPWAETDPKVADLHYDANPNALLYMNKLRKGLKFVVDDEDLADQASKCGITVAGYDTVAKMKSNIAMRVFVNRVAHAKGWTLTDERALGNLVWEHSGARRSQSLQALIKDLEEAKWAVDTAAATPAQGGYPAKGSGKGAKGSPPPPPGVAVAAPDTPAVADPAPEGKGKSGPPLAPGKEGKGGGRGKGPGAPTAAGAKAGGAPPAAGAKGKGKADMMKVIIQPTREEKKDWVKKKTNKLWWKRHLQQQGAIEASVFQGDEVEVNMTEFTGIFELQEKKVEIAKVEKKILPPLWDGNDKQDPGKRRMELSLLVKGSFKKEYREAMFRHLENLEFEEIITHGDFDNDNFERLAVIAAAINPDETKKLKEKAETAVTCTWDENVEGVFAKLVGIPKFSQRLQWMMGHLTLERDARMLEQLERIRTGINAILSSTVFPLMCKKVLSMGNCLNAGDDAKLGRADGFEIIPLFKDTICENKPKGNNDMSILNFLKTVELTEDERSQFQELSDQLSDWEVPKEEEPDPADLGELTNKSGKFTRDLMKLEKCLQEERTASAQDAAGRFMEKCLETHRRESSEIDAQLDTLKQSLKTLQKYLIYTPAKKPSGGNVEDRDYRAALLLGVINKFVKVMAADGVQQKRPRVSTGAGGDKGKGAGKNPQAAALAAAFAGRKSTGSNQ